MKATINTEVILIFLKKWWFSFLLIIPTWLVVHQFYLALARNILQAVNYAYPPLFGLFFFVLDTVTLFIHEAGHTFFVFFQWEFLTILGGTLLQLLIPCLMLLSAWWNKQKQLSQFSLFWLGFSWMDTAAYCADAMYRDLPLIGNLPKSAHDFYNMLTMAGLLDHYRTIAWFFYIIGLAILILGIAWPVINIKSSKKIDLSSQLEKAGLDT